MSLIVLGLSLLLTSGCSTIGFYAQATRGHLGITSKRQSIEELLMAEDTPNALKTRLLRIQDIRRFAIDELQLPDSGSYTLYADIGRDAAVWIVTAAPADSLVAHQWCYPFVGCLGYRGYFSLESAQEVAASLALDGLDTAVMPSLAYSTLGVMKDPVLNTMLVYDDLQLAGILFHEMTHEKLFVKGDTAFNESYASAVERIGTRHYARTRNLAIDSGALEQRRLREREFFQFLLDARSDLERIYASSSGADLLAAKAVRLERMVSDYELMVDAWGDFRGFDYWFADGPPNNADLALLASYEGGVEAFVQLYAEVGDLAEFHRRVAEMADWSMLARRRFMGLAD